MQGQDLSLWSYETSTELKAYGRRNLPWARLIHLRFPEPLVRFLRLQRAKFSLPVSKLFLYFRFLSWKGYYKGLTILTPWYKDPQYIQFSKTYKREYCNLLHQNSIWTVSPILSTCPTNPNLLDTNHIIPRDI